MRNERALSAMDASQKDGNQTKSLIGLGVFVVGLSIGGLAFAESGPFTKQQAEDGHVKFNNLCAQCHKPDLTGALGPALVGTTFKQHWGGKSVSDLRSFIYNNMPATAPKSLTDDKLDPIVAWILSKNGIQPGDKPMSKEAANAPIPK
jgi:mono/diheme cytochrome c family protein